MMERAMREEEPDPMPDAVSAQAAESCGLSEAGLRQELSGDLATIVAKCLSARPENRYISVDALLQDVHYYLEGRPIMARPLTIRYRVGKFIRRHRWGVTATVFVLLMLIASLGYAEWRQQQALLEGRRAEHMQTFMYSLFKLANSNYTGKPAATVPEFLNLGVKLLPDYITDPTDLRQAQLSLAESMFDNEDLVSAQKVFAQVIASAKAANDVNAEAEAEAFSGNIAYLQGNDALGKQLTSHALSLSHKAGVSPTARVWSALYYAYNQENEGFRSDENLHLYQFAIQESREKHLSKRETTDVLFLYGEDLELRGRTQEAIDIFNETLAAYGDDPSTLCEQSATYGEIASSKEMSGAAPAETLALYQRSYEGAARCSGPESRAAITELDYVAADLMKLGRSAEALPMLEKIGPAWEKLAAGTPDLAEYLYFLTMAYNNTGHYIEAENTAAKMIAVQEGKVAPTDRRMGASHMMWAQALAGQHRYREALPHAVIADRLLLAGAHSVGAKKMGADAHALLLDIQEKLGKESARR
jgi:serine/threonine-protein kinase